MTKKLGFALLVGLMAAGCGGNKQTIKTNALAKKSKKGYPEWITNPYQSKFGINAQEAICAAGQSTLGLTMGNVDAARTDAEIQVKNRLAEQLEAEVGLLQERVNSVLKDMTTGREVGDKSLKNINKNFQKTQLVGMRYLATYMHPDPISPSKIFVLGCITVDFANIAKDIRNQMLTASQVQDQLDFKHKEAMLYIQPVKHKVT
jgi:hypothetical protein